MSDDAVRIGWIGCGRMGSAMASRLIVAGNDVTVTNRTMAKTEPLVALGATAVEHPRDLAGCDIVFVMVSANADLVDVTFVFGSKLPAGGRCVATQAELGRYWRRKEPVVCYVIEVCCGCRWNHLARMYPAGAGVDAVARKPLRARTTPRA